MRILGIDSATAEASVALIEDDRLLGEERHPPKRRQKGGKQPNHHAEVILPLVETLLARHDTRIEQLAAVSVSAGPGSFTGLRIGIATAKGLVYDSGVPLVGVSTLVANARRAAGRSCLIGSILDARKGEVYGALFRSGPRKLERLTDDALISVTELIDLWHCHLAGSGLALKLIGEGARAYEDKLLAAFKSADITSEAALCTLASEVARLGCEQLANLSDRTVVEARALAPIYLRAPAAEVKAKSALST